MYYRFNSSTGGTTPNDAPSATRVGSANGTIIGTTLSVRGTGQFTTALTGTGGTTADYFANGRNTNLVSTENRDVIIGKKQKILIEIFKFEI